MPTPNTTIKPLAEPQPKPPQSQLVFGPVLGIEGEDIYTVCLVTPNTTTQVGLSIFEAGKNPTKAIPAQALYTLPCGLFWKVAFTVPVSKQGRHWQYEIVLDGVPANPAPATTRIFASTNQPNGRYGFYCPGLNEAPRLLYASCNGFSSYNLMTGTQSPMGLWQNLLNDHAQQPASLLMMGGDQIYADNIWTSVAGLAEWNALSHEEKISYTPKAKLLADIDAFYCRTYVDRLSQAAVQQALACIPNIMMWDDHDIIDGWGSYPAELQACPMHQAIFAAAKKYFEIFQLRGGVSNRSLLLHQVPKTKTSRAGKNKQANAPVPPSAAYANLPAGSLPHCSFSFPFRGYTVVALDHRSERTIETIMSETHWQQWLNTLKECTKGDLLVLSAVPVVYRDFSFAEKTLDLTPWDEELTDDLKDHWKAKAHQGERARFIMHLLNNAGLRKGKTVILSGDVHVGCLGAITKQLPGQAQVRIHQLVSSGIVHPAPTAIQWAGVLASSGDGSECLDESNHINIKMLKAFGGEMYFRTRNYLLLQAGTDQKLWANWICENQDKPVFPIE